MKIGFCFLVKKNISREYIWKVFFNSAHNSAYSIYIHAKTNTVSSLLESANVDPFPLKTEWASLSLVKATKRLLTTAFQDGCDSVVFLSGDSLPLWSFNTIEKLCTDSLFSLQPSQNLNATQINQFRRESNRIKTFYGLESSIRLVKQNMFFSLTKSDFELIQDISVDNFPAQEVPDEYFWANHLIIKGAKINDSNFIFVNDDPTKTQSLSWIIDRELLHFLRSKGYLFIRKANGFADTMAKKYYSKLIS